MCETLRVARNLSTFEQTAVARRIDTTSESPAMRSALDLIVRVAQSDIPLLLRGENGTGKSVFAELMHRRSERASGPFVTVNCPSLSDELLMSELFGHVKGAFTGAVADQKGKVAVAEGGTLFLDELGDLSQAVQAKLLRFLQEQRYERLGDTVTRQSDVRIVGATNRDLEALITQGLFARTCSTGSMWSRSTSRRCASARPTSSRSPRACSPASRRDRRRPTRSSRRPPRS
jgi:NtrC-family two-component system response regulator AlgB